MAALPILEAAILAVVAPLSGVVLAVREFRGARRAIGIAVTLLLVSAAVTATSAGWSREALSTTLASHVMLGMVAVALAAVGAWCATVWRDPLDAAAASVAAACVATFGLLAAGPVAGDLPTRFVNAAMMVSPVVSTASAANIDLLRTDQLYRISPLAHGRFDYPSWYSAVALYGAVLLICAAATARARRKASA